MITCRRAAEWTSRELDERLSAGRRFALGFHRLVCVQCRRFRDQLAAVDAVAGELLADGVVGSVGLPDAAKERIAQVLKEVGG